MLNTITRRVFLKRLSVGIPLIAPFAGCNRGSEKTPESDAPRGKKIIIYFSHSGNTKTIADKIQTLTGADWYEIVPVEPYPKDHDTVVAQAKREQEEDFRPKIQENLPNLKNYDTCFLGSPCWWGTIAMPVMTFLEKSDFTSKTIFPFMTHEGSHFGRTLADLRHFCPDASVHSGFTVIGSQVASADSDLADWLRSIGMIS